MAAPANYDMTIWKGNDVEFQFHFMDGSANFDLTGSTLIWRATWAGSGELRQELDIDSATGGTATLSLTHTQTRTLSSSKVVSYEIERRIGGAETTLLYGTVTVSGGVNDDAA